MSCYVPDIIRPVVAISMNLEAIPIDYDAMTAKPQSAFETFDSCRVMVGDHCGSELVTIDGVVYKVEYGIDINGIPIVVVTNNKTGERATEIENAMNVALEELFYDGFFKNGNGGELSVSDIFDNMVKLRDMIREINKFSQENSSKWGDITGRASGYKGEFMYNATRGAAIADGMKKDDETIFYVGNHDKGQYDMEIGFWTSYWARQKGMNVGYYTTGRGDGEDILGLLDMALIMKALMYKENGTLDPNRTNINTYDDGSYHSTDYGLTMVNGLYFDEHQEKMTSVNFRKGDLWKTDPFYNIGCGMGILYLKAGQGHTLNDWIDNIEKYNPGDRRGGEVLWYFQKMKQKYYPNVKWPYKQPKKPLPPPYYVPGPGDPVRQP